MIGIELMVWFENLQTHHTFVIYFHFVRAWRVERISASAKRVLRPGRPWATKPPNIENKQKVIPLMHRTKKRAAFFTQKYVKFITFIVSAWREWSSLCYRTYAYGTNFILYYFLPNTNDTQKYGLIYCLKSYVRQFSTSGEADSEKCICCGFNPH